MRSCGGFGTRPGGQTAGEGSQGLRCRLLRVARATGCALGARHFRALDLDHWSRRWRRGAGRKEQAVEHREHYRRVLLKFLPQRRRRLPPRCTTDGLPLHSRPDHQRLAAVWQRASTSVAWPATRTRTIASSQIQPASSRRASSASSAMWSSPAFRQGTKVKFSPPCSRKALARPDRDLLQRLDAVGGEARRHDREVLDPCARQLQDRLVGVRPQPLLAAEARLEGQAQTALVPAEALAQQPRGLGALAMVRVAEHQVALGQAVERGEHDLRPPGQAGEVVLDRARERLDVDGMLEVGRRGAHRRLPALLAAALGTPGRRRSRWSPRHTADRGRTGAAACSPPRPSCGSPTRVEGLP